MRDARWNPRALLADAEELYAGGLTVRTPPDAGEGAAILAETVIQPNGDVLLKLNPALAAGDDAWVSHMDRVRLRVEQYRFRVRALRMATHWAFLGVSIPLTATLWTGTRRWLFALAGMLVPVVLHVTLRVAIRFWAKKLLKAD